MPLSIAASLGAALLLNSPLARFQPLLPHCAVRAGRHDAGRGRGDLALPASHRATASSTTRSAQLGIAPDRLARRSALGDAGDHPVRGVEELRLQHGHLARRACRAFPTSCTRRRASTARRAGSSSAHITLPMLAPTFCCSSAILTIAGYFQLFAEPYVMTQGGPLQSTVSVLYFMYEEGFKWWNLGSRVGGRVPAVRCSSSRSRCCSSAPSRRAGMRMKRAARHRRSSTARCSPLAALDAVSAAVDGRRVVHAAGRSERVSAAAPARAADARATIASCSRAPAWAAISLNSVGLATRGDGAVARVQRRWPATRSPSCASRGRDGIFKLLLGALVIPAQVAMVPLFLLLKQLRPRQQLRRRHRPGLASIFGIFLVRQYALSIPDDCSTPRASTARASGGSSARSCVPLLRPILVTLAVFTLLGTWNDFMWPLIVLTDQRALHAAGRAREPRRASTCRTTS